MRVTNNMIIYNMTYNLQNNLERINEYQNQMSTGKTVDKPSDDPVAASKILKYRSDLSQLEMFEANAEDARSWMEITESSTNDVTQAVQRARELTVQMANGIYTLEEKQKVALELEEIKEHIIQDGNTSYAGRYVFSNFYTDEPLFNDDGTYNIPMTDQVINERDPILYEIAIGEEMDVNTSPVDVFGYVQAVNAMIDGVPDAEGNGTAATKASKSGTFDLTYDFSGATDDIDITIDGTIYTIDNADLSAMIASSINPHEKADVVDLIRNADDGVPVPPSGLPTPLGEVADVYFDANDQLVIKSRTYGAAGNIDIDYGTNPAAVATAFGLAAGSVSGVDITDATVEDNTKTIDPANFLDPDIVQEYRDNTFVVTLNGETKEIQLDPADPLTSVAELATAMENALDTAFGGNYIDVTVAGGPAPNEYLSFTTINQPNNENAPSLQIETVQATESKLINDLDNIIASLQNDDGAATISAYLDEIDDDLERLLTAEGSIGARFNRVELIINRIEENNLTYTSLKSEAEDADMAEVIMLYQNAQNVYRASLSTGAQAIQPTLVDFIR